MDLMSSPIQETKGTAMVVKQFITGGVTVRIHDDRCKSAVEVNMTVINRIMSSSYAARANRSPVTISHNLESKPN